LDRPAVDGVYVSSRHDNSRLLNAAHEASPMKPGSEDCSCIGFSGCLSKSGLKRLLSSFESDGGSYSSWVFWLGKGVNVGSVSGVWLCVLMA
jgi:hypothetical protein